MTIPHSIDVKGTDSGPEKSRGESSVDYRHLATRAGLHTVSCGRYAQGFCEKIDATPIRSFGRSARCLDAGAYLA